MSMLPHPARTKVLDKVVHPHDLVEFALGAGNRRRSAETVVDVDVGEGWFLLGGVLVQY